MAATRHIYESFIRATPGEVWAAITQPEFTRRYFHHTAFTTDLRPGSAHRYVLPDGADAVDGIIEEVEPGRRLVLTWHVLYDSAMAEEPPGRVEWILRPANDEGTVTRVTLRHLDLGMSPLTSNNVAVGWVGVLESMKSLLETGEGLGDLHIDSEPSSGDDRSAHRRLAAAANGEAWELLSTDNLDESQRDELVERAHASAYHWRRGADPEAVEQARACWLLARAHIVARNVEPALRQAARCAVLTEGSPGSKDFDVAYAHEARARALALAGRGDDAERERAAALAVPIAAAEDRTIVEADIAAGPWFDLAVEASA